MYSNEFQSIVEYRRSNRKFDPAVDVPEEVMQRSLERTTLSPNSSNMQLWEFHWIHDRKLLEEFVPLCLGQSAAKTAKELVVFVTRRDLYRKRARWNKAQILSHIGEREPNAFEKNGLAYYGKVMPLLYGRDILGIHTLVRRSVCFFGGLFKPFMRLVVERINASWCTNRVLWQPKPLCCLSHRKDFTAVLWRVSISGGCAESWVYLSGLKST